MLQTGSEGSQQLFSHCAAIIWFGWTLEVQVFGRSVPPSPQICQEELGKAHAVFGVRAESPHFFTSRDGMRNTRYAFPISLGVLFIYLFLHSFPSFNSFWIFSHIKQTVFFVRGGHRGFWWRTNQAKVGYCASICRITNTNTRTQPPWSPSMSNSPQ